MSEEESIPLRGGEEAELLRQLEEENTERGEAIAGSYLRRLTCTVCRERPTLATAERAAVAICGPCLAESTGGGGSPVGVPLRPVVGYPMGTDSRPMVERAAHPAPIVSSRDRLMPEKVPAPVTSLAEYAREKGWDVLTQYAKGQSVHGTTGKPTALVESFAVRMFLGDRAANAVYVGGSSWTWKSVWIISNDHAPFGKAGVSELKEWLAAQGDVSPEWFTEIAEKREDQERRQKQRAACDRGAHADIERRGKMAFCPHCEHEWPAAGQSWRKPKKAKEHA